MTTTIRTALLALLLVAALGAIGAPRAAAFAPGQGPGGPVLVIASSTDPFSRYYAEILTAEGLNEFDVVNLGDVTAQSLASHRVVVLAQNDPSPAQADLLRTWVRDGGDLVAMRPTPPLADVLGLTPAGGTVGGAAGDRPYIKVNGSGPSAGITTDPMQFHGTADRWTLSGATELARLWSSATQETPNPAVTLHSYGSGQAAAFTYDLARSVVLTRQGNPAWVGQDRDNALDNLVRSDDLFYGNASFDPQPDWVNLNNVQVPQADEQQRLLANLVTRMSADRMPLPRFWYFPRDEKAVVVLTGDDHASNGTTGQFNRYDAESPAGCSVADWECIRSTSYVYPNTPIDPAQARAFDAKGFEIALHVTTGCADYTAADLRADWQSQLPDFRADFPGLPDPVTNRTHCIAWSGWVTQPIVEREFGVRLDTNYYYWPGSWVQNRPGMFTGSGIPMRFADTNGALVDVYQATTQMTDESEIDVGLHIRTLLGNALGDKGYYGAFTANMHTDRSDHADANTIVAEARARGVPVIAARQLLEWLDGRNGSSFSDLTFSGRTLSFRLNPAAGARGLRAMLPVNGPTGDLTGVTLNGAPVATTRETIKGVGYVAFDATGGAYAATYGSAPPPPPPPPPPDTTPPDTRIGNGTVAGTTATFAFSSPDADVARFECRLDGRAWAACGSPMRYAGLSRGDHTFAVRAVDRAGNADPTPASRTFTVTASPPPAPDRKAPRVSVNPRTVRVARSGAFTLRATCPLGERRCRVDLRIRLGRRELARRLGLSIAGGRTARVRLRLSRDGRRRLARARSLRVSVRASARDAAGNRATTTTRVKLLAPRRR